MNRNVFVFVFAALIIIPACKSNKEAYSKAYQRMKEKDSAQQSEKMQIIQAATSPSVTGVSVNNTVSNVQPPTDSEKIGDLKTEVWTIVQGKPSDLNSFNVVVGTFVNRTNATSFYQRMVDEKRSAVLVLNADKMYRIIVASSAIFEDAKSKKQELMQLFPKALIVISKGNK